MRIVAYFALVATIIGWVPASTIDGISVAFLDSAMQRKVSSCLKDSYHKRLEVESGDIKAAQLRDLIQLLFSMFLHHCIDWL